MFLAKITNKNKKPIAKPKRPLGVTVLAILAVLGGILLLFSGIGIGSSPTLFTSMPNMAYLAPIAADLGIVFIILGLIALVSAYGLWTGKKWGWWITIIISALGVLLNLISLVSGSYGAIVGIIIEVVILYYMTRPYVKAYFGIKM